MTLWRSFHPSSAKTKSCVESLAAANQDMHMPLAFWVPLRPTEICSLWQSDRHRYASAGTHWLEPISRTNDHLVVKIAG